MGFCVLATNCNEHCIIIKSYTIAVWMLYVPSRFSPSSHNSQMLFRARHLLSPQHGQDTTLQQNLSLQQAELQRVRVAAAKQHTHSTQLPCPARSQGRAITRGGSAAACTTDKQRPVHRGWLLHSKHSTWGRMSGPPSPALVVVAPPGDPLGGGLSSPHSSPDVSCEGYVGQGAAPAGEYHDCDFDWEEHARAVRHVVDEQEARGRELQRLQAVHQASPGHMQGPAADGNQAGLPTEARTGCSKESDSGHSGHEKLAGQQDQHQRSTAAVPGEQPQPAAAAASTAPQTTATDTTATTSATLPVPTDSTHPAAPSTSQAVAAYDHASWEEFYRAHPSAKFFKERRYLLLEFPQLLRSDAPLHVAEIGCGCGSSLLPVLKANPSSRATGTDISSTCLEQLQAAARLEGIAPERLHLFPADATDPSLAPAFAPIAADALLIMFTLSAVVPEQQLVMLAHAYGSLRPGGQLLIRDHGLYDMVQLRIPAEQWVEPNTYKRGDKTIAHFFSTEALAERARAVGFEVQECKYVTVVNRNRKKGQELRRVFVHGVFVRPE